MTSPIRGRPLRYVRGLLPPMLLLGLVVSVVIYTLMSRMQADERYDEAALREWIEESRVFRLTLPELAREYLEGPTAKEDPDAHQAAVESLREHLNFMGDLTKRYQTQGQLPLFPVIYRLEVVIAGAPAHTDVLVWDSHLPRREKRIAPLEVKLYDQSGRSAILRLDYQLHAYDKRQQAEADRQVVLMWLGVLAVAAAVLGAGWIYFFLRRERQRELGELLALRQIDHAKRAALENELRRQAAERKHQESERALLEQRIATEEAERRGLEIKSQLYAGIGIMAGSYAHNIKNLLVRPHDLLRRCLEADGMPSQQQQMLEEVQGTLGTVTERLQQILKTVRRDPTKAEFTRLDLNELVQEIHRSWTDMARDKWKLGLTIERCSEPLSIHGDASHLAQAIENLVFNARDATFEMRNVVRDRARQDVGLSSEERRKALIDAAGWKGTVAIRTVKNDMRAILEVTDNGIGMTDEVRRRCMEAHFTTKRDNAIHEGNTAGMGLGLAFVRAILDHHHAELEIVSEPFRGATFRLAFPMTSES